MAACKLKSVVVVCFLCVSMNVIAQKLDSITPQVISQKLGNDQSDNCPIRQCPFECRMASRQSNCRDAFDKTGKVTLEFISGIGYMFRNKSFAEFSQKKLNDALSAGFLDEQKLTCPTLKRFAIEIATTKVTVILDLVKKRIASLNQTLPRGSNREISEIYGSNYAKTLHSLIKQDYHVKLSEQAATYKTCICGRSQQFDCITRATLKTVVCQNACEHLKIDPLVMMECKWPMKLRHGFKEFCIKEKVGKLPKGPMSSSDLSSMMKLSMDYVIGQLKPEYTEDVILERQEEIKGSCKKMGKARTTDLRNQVKNILKQNRSNKTISSTVTKILTACGASVGELKLYVSNRDLVEAYDPSVKMSRREAAKMKKYLLTEKGNNMGSLSKEELTKYLPLIAQDKRQIQKLDSSTLKRALPEINKLAMTSSQRRKTWRKLKEDSAFQNLSAISKDTLLTLGATIGALQPKEIRNIPVAALGEAISTGNLTGAQFSRKAASDVFEKFKRHLGKTDGNLTADELENMGSNLHCLRARQFEAVSGAELIKLLENKALENSQSDHCRLDKQAIRIIAAKVKGEKGGTNVLMTSPLFRREVGDIDDSVIDDLVNKLMNGDSIEDFKFTRRQAFKVLNSLKTDLGNLSTWTVELVNNIAVTNLLTFVTPADMEDLQNNPSSVEFLHLFNQDGVVSEKNNKMLGKILVEKFGLDNSSADMSTSGLTEDIVRQVGSEVIGRLSNDQLKKLNMTDTITDLLTSINLNTIPCSTLQKRAQFIIEEKGFLNLTNEDVQSLGNLKCGFVSSHVELLTTRALAETGAEFAKCPCVSMGVKKEILNKMKQKSLIELSPPNYREDDLATIGLLITVEDPSAIATVNTSAMLAGYSELMNDKRAFKEMRRQRRERGFFNDLTNAEKMEEAAANKALGKLILNTIIASKSLRRKRQVAGSLTCAEIQEMDTETLSSLTVELINALADDQFADCAAVLGVVPGYSKEQLEALAAVAKRPGVWGDPANWNSSNIQEAAVIVQGLSLAEINQMSFDLNAASKLGEFNVWSDDKKAAIFNGTLTELKYVGAKQLTASDIRSLGHILCGAPINDLATIPADVYGSAADAVGAVTSCSIGQLFVFSNLAMLYFGSDISHWNASTINSLGVVVGELGDQVSKFKGTQLNAIEAKYIPYLPKSFIVALSNEQLGNFSMEQAQALSVKQLCVLDLTKWTILEKIATTTLQTSSCNKTVTTTTTTTTTPKPNQDTTSSTKSPDKKDTTLKSVTTTSTTLQTSKTLNSSTIPGTSLSGSAKLVPYSIGSLIMLLILTFVIS